MKEEEVFPEQYKKLVDGNLSPDPVWDEEMRRKILLLMFPRDPPGAGESSTRSEP